MSFPRGQYGVIYADPPWAYEMYSDKGHGKSPSQHYECMSAAELLDMRDDVLWAAVPDCVLFMWTTWPMLEPAMTLMAHWGFRYKTGGAWHKKTVNNKTTFGTGYVLRSACEPFLIGTVGAPKALNRSTRNVIEAQVREHSRKPDSTYDLIEKLFDGPYLELFARHTRPGWDVWGNETDKFKGENHGN